MRVPVDEDSLQLRSLAPKVLASHYPSLRRFQLKAASQSVCKLWPQHPASDRELERSQACSADTGETQLAPPPLADERNVPWKDAAAAKHTTAGNTLRSTAPRKQTRRRRARRATSLLPTASGDRARSKFFAQIVFALSSAVNFALASPARPIYRNAGESGYPNLAPKVYEFSNPRCAWFPAQVTELGWFDGVLHDRTTPSLAP